jgi:MoaA/NifB/PqqE/SkfB family radical SAM enzyme
MFSRFIRKAVKVCLPYGIVILVRKYRFKKSVQMRLKQRETLRFSVHLVDHCNLNCKCCFACACIADEKYIAVDVFEKDCKRMYELAGNKVDLMILSGGEPLLHPEILKIFDIAGKYFGKSVIMLITNGILLEKQKDDFWENCRRNNVKVSVTRYPINIPLAKIKQTAKKHKVVLEYFVGTEIDIRKAMSKVPFNLAGGENPQKSFELCKKANTCIVLEEGKLYTCSTIPAVKHFNKRFGVNLEVCDKDYVNIYRINSITEIFEFLNKPMPFCRYCNVKGTVNHIEWSVSKKEITEWI